MRVLICGGRDYEDSFIFNTIVDKVFRDRGIADPIIIHGAADGADTLADDYAKVESLRCLRFPAKWYPNGKFFKGAGPVRNKQMLEQGKPHLVLAFPTPNSKGTWHMIKIAKEANVEVLVFEQKEV